LLSRMMISPDGKAMAINVTIAPNSEDPEYYSRVTDEIEKVIQPLRGRVDEVFQLGLSYLRTVLADYVMGDQVTMVPLSVAALLIIVAICLRSANGAILPCLTAGLSILWTFGFMSLLNIPINVLTAIVPSLLIVIGSTEDMHMVAEYLAGVEAGRDRLGAIEYMANKVGIAVFLTALTTYLGFLSITVNKITLLRQFGVVASFGLAANFLVTCSVAPVYLRYFGDRKKPGKHGKHTDHPHGTLWEKIAAGTIHLIVTRKRALLWGMVLGACLIGTGIVNIKLNNDLLGYFKYSSPINVRSRILHRDLAGAQNFFVTIDSNKEGAFSRPENLRKVYDIQRYLEKRGDIDSSLSLADYIALVNREMNGGDQSAYVIPRSDDLIAQYLILFQRYDIERYVSPDFSKANIIVRHNISSSHKLKGLLKELSRFLEGTLGPGLSFNITSEGILINKAADTMAAGQAASVSLVLVVIFLIMSLLFVRVKAGLLALVPNLFPIVIIFGIMGLFGIPLNTGTAMIGAIALGIAVDDTIHIMVRYNSEMKRLNNQEEAIAESLRNEIRPVVTTSVGLTVGFSILGFSNFTPVIYFGLLSALVMLLALAGDMLLTPILLSETRLITLWDMLGLELREQVVKRSPLFTEMTAWQVKKIVLSSHMETFPEGSRIIRRNEFGRVMYLILDGSARVEIEKAGGNRAHIQDLQAGDVFGEVALVDAGRRTADVVALKETRVLAMDWESLRRIRRMFPHTSTKLFLNISNILGSRLAARTEQWIARS
jgi:predicted RND superfamily exporter protein